MSMSRLVTIPCPKCNTEYEIRIFDSVNTDYSENIALDLISGNFFCHICPSCGYKTIVNHDLLYNDMKHGIFIWLVHNNPEKAIGYVHKNALDYCIPSRIVRNLSEFREKISIIESGFDDRIIEIEKYLLFLALKDTDPDLDIDDFEFERASYISTLYRDEFYDHPILPAEKLFALDRNIEVALAAEISSYIIDVEWAEGFVAKHFSAISKMAEDKSVSMLELWEGKNSPHESVSNEIKHTLSSPATVKQKSPLVQFISKHISLLIFLAFIFSALCNLLWTYVKESYIYKIALDAPDEISLLIGESYKLNYDISHDEISSSLSFDLSNPTVIDLSQNGEITALAEGSAVVSLLFNGNTRDSCTVNVTPQPVEIQNGKMLVHPESHGNSKVVITAPLSASCYAYFQNTDDEALDFSVYVSAGSSVSVNAFEGNYDFYYAFGETWYGEDRKFGKHTDYYKDTDTFHIAADGVIIDFSVGFYDSPISPSYFPH